MNKTFCFFLFVVGFLLSGKVSSQVVTPQDLGQVRSFPRLILGYDVQPYNGTGIFHKPHLALQVGVEYTLFPSRLRCKAILAAKDYTSLQNVHLVYLLLPVGLPVHFSKRLIWEIGAFPAIRLYDNWIGDIPFLDVGLFSTLEWTIRKNTTAAIYLSVTKGFVNINYNQPYFYEVHSFRGNVVDTYLTNFWPVIGVKIPIVK